MLSPSAKKPALEPSLLLAVISPDNSSGQVFTFKSLFRETQQGEEAEP